MTPWVLPESAEIGGKRYEIHSDYRDILEIIQCLQNEEDPKAARIYLAMALFYDGFDEIPPQDYEEAAQWMSVFIGGGEEEHDPHPAHKLIDWEQDSRMIISDINKVAGCDIRTLPFAHWWTFLSWVGGIGEGQLSTVVSIREKRRKGKKLEKWEQEYYQEHRSIVDFKKKYTKEELEEQERIKKMLGE